MKTAETVSLQLFILITGMGKPFIPLTELQRIRQSAAI